MPTAGWILAAVGMAFLLLGLTEVTRKGWSSSPRGRTWLTMAAIFLVVAAYLFWSSQTG